jgi:hypothetical protein
MDVELGELNGGLGLVPPETPGRLGMVQAARAMANMDTLKSDARDGVDFVSMG